MKYTLKSYATDTLMLGLSVSIISVLPLIFKTSNIAFSKNSSNAIVITLIILSLVFPFLFGILFSQKLNKKSSLSYLTVLIILETISILHITMPDTYFMFLFPNEMWVRGLFNNYNQIRDIIIACLVPVLYIILYFLGSLLKYNKENKL